MPHLQWWEWVLWIVGGGFGILVLIGWLHDMEETFGPLHAAQKRQMEIIKLEQEKRLRELRGE